VNEKTIALVDLGSTVAKLQGGYGGRYVYLTITSPSDTDDHRYSPAESVSVTLDKDKLKALITALGQFVVEVSNVP
jgi:hypothetical protein